MPTSVWRLRYDVVSVRLLLAMVHAGGPGGPRAARPEVHRFLADRYAALAAHARRRGRLARADALTAKAQAHADAAGDDDLPPAIAVGMPISRPRIATDARGRVVAGPWRRGQRTRTTR